MLRDGGRKRELLVTDYKWKKRQRNVGSIKGWGIAKNMDCWVTDYKWKEKTKKYWVSKRIGVAKNGDCWISY